LLDIDASFTTKLTTLDLSSQVSSIFISDAVWCARIFFDPETQLPIKI